ncbi:hypothetical protein [Desulfitobacterium sp.]|uniref:hypothetical protein n=1 Tax=Desulfitobacterium sp. TaxID=49981 RepID=UPI002BC30717|nr:hypothetical protein [Desulfitobacterium sp.]HVJ50648.1 hypothetical protein [Desulfitobacterium sp.]
MSEEKSWAAYEQAIKQIRSVLGARIKASAEGEIEEIHVLANSNRNPKQIVRDVESLLATQFEAEIDHKKVSVVQIDEEDETTIPFQETIRPKLVSVTIRTVQVTAEVKVELSVGEKILEGIAQGRSSSYNKLRLFAEATIQALTLITMEKLILVAEDVNINSLGKHKVVQSAITLITPNGEQTLVGCAIIKSDEREAVVRATLDAVNRKLWFC